MIDKKVNGYASCGWADIIRFPSCSYKDVYSLVLWGK